MAKHNKVSVVFYLIGLAMTLSSCLPSASSSASSSESSSTSEAPLTHVVKWLDEDESVLYQEEIEEGKTPTHPLEEPTKEMDEEYYYQFKEWDENLKPVTGPQTYTAIYDQAKRVSYDYEITEEGISLKSINLVGFDDEFTIPEEIDGLPVIALQERTFANSSWFKNVTLPSTLKYIYDFAFSPLRDLVTINIPAAVTYIAHTAFDNCKELKTIFVDSKNQNYATITNSILTNKDRSKIIRYPEGKKDKTFHIPLYVTQIGEEAFKRNDYIETITLHTDIEHFGRNPFYDCSLKTTEYKGGKYLGGEDKQGKKIKHIYLFQYYDTDDDASLDIEIHSDALYLDLGLFWDRDKDRLLIPAKTRLIHSYELSFNTAADFGQGVSFTKVIVDPNNNHFKTIDDVLYNFDQTKLVIYPPEKSGDAFIIPAGVTSLGEYAFCSSYYLKTITFPSSLTEIEKGAFHRSQLLSNINFSTNLTKIGDMAFFGNPKLVTIALPASLVHIGNMAFSYCYYLKRASIGENVNYIGMYAFSNSSSLAEISVSTDNSSYSSSDNILYNKEGNEIIYAGGVFDDEYRVKEGTTFIHPKAFTDAKAEKIILPSSLTSISEMAFNGNKHLAEVIISAGTTVIGYSAFSGCIFLNNISLPNTIERIDHYAFFDCVLHSLELPENLTYIGYRAFDGGFYKEMSVYIPNSVTTIMAYAFDFNETLTINCQANRKPIGWYDNFSDRTKEVVWSVDLGLPLI